MLSRPNLVFIDFDTNGCPNLPFKIDSLGFLAEVASQLSSFDIRVATVTPIMLTVG